MRLIPFLILVILFSCKTEQTPIKNTGLISENAMVVSAREEASEIGLSILKQGGNKFDTTLQKAADAPRFHHQWLQDEITFEEGFSIDILHNLKLKGYTTSQNEAQILGSITAILVMEDDKLEAGVDKRRDYKGLGF